MMACASVSRGSPVRYFHAWDRMRFALRLAYLVATVGPRSIAPRFRALDVQVNEFTAWDLDGVHFDLLHIFQAVGVNLGLKLTVGTM